MLYLNYAALCPTHPEAEQEVESTLMEFKEYLYSDAGIQWYRSKIQRCRDAVAQLLNVSDPSFVAFVPNASMANYLILSSVRWNPGDIILSSTHENPSIRNELLALKHRGVETRFLPPSSTPHQFLVSIHQAVHEQKIRAIVLSHVSHVDGRIFPIAGIGEFAKEHNILFIVDGAQAAGHIPVDFNNLECDGYFFSGYKWCEGPLGTGSLVVTERLLVDAPSVLSKPIPEGQPLASHFEIGTHNIGLYAGLAKACEQKNRDGMRINQLLKIQEIATQSFEQIRNVQFRTWDGPHAPGILTIQCLDLKHHDKLMKLFQKENIVVKEFRDYPEGEIPAIRMSWASHSDQPNVLLALKQYSKL